jgi:hypothetical protein
MGSVVLAYELAALLRALIASHNVSISHCGGKKRKKEPNVFGLVASPSARHGGKS